MLAAERPTTLRLVELLQIVGEVELFLEVISNFDERLGPSQLPHRRRGIAVMDPYAVSVVVVDENLRPQGAGAVEIVQPSRHRIVCQSDLIAEQRMPHDLARRGTCNLEVPTQPPERRGVHFIVGDALRAVELRQPFLNIRLIAGLPHLHSLPCPAHRCPAIRPLDMTGGTSRSITRVSVIGA